MSVGDTAMRRPIGRRRRDGSDEGFTLIELMVACGVMLTVLAALAYGGTAALADIALNRQRQTASGLANKTLEQLRSLPFDVVKRGMHTADLSGDTNITVAGGVYRFRGGNRIPNATLASTSAPIYPHRADRPVAGTTYHVKTYLSHFQDNPVTNVIQATVVVDWDRGARAGISRKVEVSTLIHSPSGCTSTATHPYSAPCQPFLFGTAGTENGAVTVTGFVDGVAYDDASLLLPEVSATIQNEQIAVAQVLARASAGQITIAGAPSGAGGTAVSLRGDTDPSSSAPLTSSSSAAGQVSQTLAVGSPNRLSVTTAAGDTSDGVANAENPASSCRDASETFRSADSQPCSSASTRQLGTSTLDLDLVGGFGLARLARVDASPNLSRAHANRAVTAEGSICAGTSGDGCLRTEAVRRLGTVELMGLPAGVSAPGGWLGYLVRLESYADSVTAEAGRSSNGPSVVSRTGTIRYWNGSGYTAVALGPGSTGTLPLVSASGSASGGINVNVSGTLQIGPAGTSSSCSGTCTRTLAESSVQSPVLATFRYVAVRGGTPVADLTISVNLGTLRSKVSYAAAP